MEELDEIVFSIMFDVDGMPPRKDGGHSMWNKDKEVNKLIELRKQLDAALQKHQIPTPITDYLKLKVEIYLPKKHLEKSDIDNLVGGICDVFKKQIINPN
ncbi:RusA family crossover junction endodeoxyribonuclease [Lederbergia citrea]|uniref:RusA family crossover junction endodeoxyribonuclease n=1 Tax=Lederbergia citrea TaxID=2833581 RepID=A0A942ULV5_9BACI|nr:RusA family crossover junction endodeoxyribonuclease [Lederbergia citrea]MBS4223836.1 RusA family crossover junction endodeoxyribonuclease [Lederbergia citrea]